MTDYEAGFLDGERDAFASRRAGEPLQSLVPAENEYQRGFRDGYLPRRAEWWVRPTRIVRRDEVAA